MRLALLGYCLGIVLIIFFPVLDKQLLIASLAVLLCVALGAWLFQFNRMIVLSAGMLVGLGWHWCWAVDRLEKRISTELEGADLLVYGVIDSIPTKTSLGQRFLFTVEQSAKLPETTRLQLNSFNSDSVYEFHPGDRWRLKVRLKQPHGYANPGNADQEARYFSRGISATGYVRDCECNKQLGTTMFSVPRLRISLLQSLENELQAKGVDSNIQAMVIALILGERGGLKSSDWQRFADTGTSHLFVISGLHIGLISAMAFSAINLISRLGVSQLMRVPSPVIASWAGIGVALTYSLLAGWTLPTQRAFVMCATALLMISTKKRVNVSFGFLAALAAVFSFDPLAVKATGFWLSFSAVAALLLMSQRNQFAQAERLDSLNSRIWTFNFKPQLIVWVALFVPLALFMGQVSLIAPFTNLLLIPMIGLLIVPFLLLACLGLVFGIPGSEFLLLIAAQLLGVVNSGLEYISTNELFAWSVVAIHLDDSQFMFLALGLAILFLPQKLPYRWLALPISLPLLSQPTDSIVPGDFDVHVADVGQGLAVIVNTQRHSLVFDTGAGRADEWSAGAAVLAPALKKLNITSIDRVIVSHGDNDHAGGLHGLMDSLHVSEVLASQPLASINHGLCSAGSSWQWDEVNFEFLHPDTGKAPSARGGGNSRNNRSCVLRIRSGRFGALLPGDIEDMIERRIIVQSPVSLANNLLVASHHGSKSSSSYAFLKAVNADHVVFAAGYRNAFGHPAAEVELRHLQQGSQLYHTAMDGMLSFSFRQDLLEPTITRFRQENPRYWAWSGISPPCRYCK